MEGLSRHEVLGRRTGRSSCVEFPTRRCYQKRRGIAAAVELLREGETSQWIRTGRPHPGPLALSGRHFSFHWFPRGTAGTSDGGRGTKEVTARQAGARGE